MMKGEPKYTAAEQRARMRQFEAMVRRARADWRRGYAVVLMSFRDYTKLLRREKSR
jgi:hypothetical protein